MRKIRFLSALGAAVALGLCVESCVEDVALGPSEHGDGSNAGEAGSPSGGSAGMETTGGAPSDGGAGSGTGGSSNAGGAGEGGTGGGTGGTGGSSDSGGAGDGGTGGGEPPCDTSVEPAEDACIVSDAHAVFVAPDGDDDAPGTKAAPVATFERAFELVENDARVVIACSGTYDEEVRVARGVRVYGGFDCENEWEYAPTSPSHVEPSAPGAALEIRDVDAPVVMEDMEFVAADATEPGASSMAGFVVNSAGATFRRVLFEAGNGAPGADGAPSSFVWPTAEELAGNDAQGTAGGARKQCSCPYAQDPDFPFPTLETAGGKGGDAQPGGQAGTDGEDSQKDRSGLPLPGGPGGAVGTCDPALQAGATGFDGGYGVVGGFHYELGTLTASGWLPTVIGHGVPAYPGRGGGGGASITTAGGGGGGCGGCGGKGALGGQGGGASLGLVIVDTPVTLESSSVVAHDAGNGGDGAEGQPGQEGGAGGRASPSACAGGPGGRGGKGGPGPGAVGGCSFGVLWMGANAPEIALTPIVAGQIGQHGNAGEEDAWTAPRGMAAEVISVDELP